MEQQESSLAHLCPNIRRRCLTYSELPHNLEESLQNMEGAQSVYTSMVNGDKEKMVDGSAAMQLQIC